MHTPMCQMGVRPSKNILLSTTANGHSCRLIDYLRINDPEVRTELLKDSPVWEIFREAKIEALLAKPELPNSESKFLFYFLNTKLFLEEAQA